MELDNNYLTTCIYTMRFNIYIYIYMIGLFQMESLIIIVNHINIYIYLYDGFISNGIVNNNS